MCSPELRKKSQTKNNNKKTFEHDISPLCREGGAGQIVLFLCIGWRPRRNPNFKSIASGVTELRGSDFGVFLFIFEPLLQQCYALPCYTVMNVVC